MDVNPSNVIHVKGCIQPLVRGTCGQAVPAGAPLVMCMAHLARAWEFCNNRVYEARRDNRSAWDTERSQIVTDLMSEALAEHEQERLQFLEWTANPEVDDPDSVVYYIRFGDRIKIGFSRNLGRRLTAIPHDELLTVEPGARKVEANRHRQFAPLRIIGEWFAAEAPLLEHIEQIKQRHADREKWREKATDAFALCGPEPFYTDTEVLAQL